MTPDMDKTVANTDIVFQTPLNVVDFVSLAVGENGDVYAATYEGTIWRYTPEGELVREYPGTEFLCALQYNDGFIYGFHANTKDIILLDTESRKIKVLYAGLEAIQISALAVVDESIYIGRTAIFSSIV